MYVNGRLSVLHNRLFATEAEKIGLKPQISLFSQAITVEGENVPKAAESANGSDARDRSNWLNRSEAYRQAAEASRTPRPAPAKTEPTKNEIAEPAPSGNTLAEPNAESSAPAETPAPANSDPVNAAPAQDQNSAEAPAANPEPASPSPTTGGGTAANSGSGGRNGALLGGLFGR